MWDRGSVAGAALESQICNSVSMHCALAVSDKTRHETSSEFIYEKCINRQSTSTRVLVRDVTSRQARKNERGR